MAFALPPNPWPKKGSKGRQPFSVDASAPGMIAVAATATNWTDAVSAVAAAAAALTGLLALGAVVVGSLYARGQLRAARNSGTKPRRAGTRS